MLKDYLADEQRLLESMAGRVIQRASYVDKDTAICLWLDDGRMIEFRGIWCNDNTADVGVDEALYVDVPRCTHCGKEHRDAQVLLGGWTHGGSPQLPRKSFAWCTDGNHAAMLVPELVLP